MIKLKDNKLMIIIASIILFVLSFLLKNISLILLIITYLLVGFEIYIKVIKNFGKGIIFDENFLMMIATIGAFAIGENVEAVAVMLFYQIGEYMNDLGIDKSKDAIQSLMDLRSDKAVILVNNKEKTIDPKNLKIDDMILVKPGERIPIDGIVVEGKSSVDTSSITGESSFIDVKEQSMVYSGYMNINGVLKIKVTTLFQDSTASRILKVIESSEIDKSNTEKFITKFAKIYTPIIVIMALLIFAIPTFVFHQDLSTWIYRSLIFLVASCPCALVLSVPLGYFCGIGKASQKGILIKSSGDLEKASKINAFAFDKTGTITKGVFQVKALHPVGISEEELLEIAAHGEFYSNHPIAMSIKAKYDKEIDSEQIHNFCEKDGGITVTIKKDKFLLGNYDFMKKNKIEVDEVLESGTIVYVVKNKKYVGNIMIGDCIKEEAKDLINELKKLGIHKIVMLSGDNEKTVCEVSNKIGLQEYRANLKPLDKRNDIRNLKQNYKVCFVGDGMNDAVVLLESDLGISMGDVGSDAAIEASDVIILNDNLLKIIDMIKMSKHTNFIVWENVIFALLVKFIVLVLGILGMSSILMAVFADIGVTVITVINSLRIFEKKM